MEAAKAPKSEKRRAPRIPAELLVMIEGIQDEYRLARGNISATGVMLELPSAPGSPGDLELLHLSTTDREHRVAIMGQIVRCVTIDTFGLVHPNVAVVFQFLPERPEVRRALGRLLAHVVRQYQQDDDFAIDHRIPVDVEPANDSPKAATVFRLQVKRMSVETTWPVNLGDRVQLAFRPSGARLPFEGRVVKVDPIPGGPTPLYAIEVSVGELGQRAKRRPSETRPAPDSIDIVLSDLIAGEGPLPEPAQRHLSGRLDRIPLTSLLTFLEMERQSGLLRIDDKKGTTLAVQNGQVIDVEPKSPKPRGQLETLLGLNTGRFAFTCEPVDREDRIQQSTTHILLDWARKEDEGDR